MSDRAFESIATQRSSHTKMTAIEVAAADMADPNQARAGFGKPAINKVEEPGHLDCSPSTYNGDQSFTDGQGNAQHDANEVNVGGNYVGETIKHDVIQTSWQKQPGDSLFDFAKRSLSNGNPSDLQITDDQVRAREREIMQLTHCTDWNAIPGKTSISLPGHTADGAVLTCDGNGIQIRTWSDGTIELTDPEGLSLKRSPLKDDVTVDQFSGSCPGDNFSITYDRDGNIQEKDNNTSKVNEFWDDPAINQERANLLAAAEQNINDPVMLERLIADMMRFETRAREMNLPAQEVEETYKQMERLYDPNAEGKVESVDMKLLVPQMMSQLADPTTINQSDHPTCTAASVEEVLSIKHPAAIMKLVADLALTGQSVAPDGTVMRLDPSDLTPESDTCDYLPTSGERSFASALIENSLIELALSKKNSHLRWYGTDENGGHSGRLVDYSQNPPKVVDGDPQISPDDIAHMANAFSDNRLKAYNDNTAVISYGFEGRNVDTVRSEADLRARLAELKAEHKLPAIIIVDGNNEPFWSASGGFLGDDAKNQQADSAGHAVVITDYSPGPPELVSVDPHWGAASKYLGPSGLSVHDLFLAMQPLKSDDETAALRKDVEWNRQHAQDDPRQIDTMKEFDLLRHERETGQLTEQQYFDDLMQQIRLAQQRWREEKAEGTFDENDFNRADRLLYAIAETLPDDQDEAMNKLWDSFGSQITARKPK